MYSFKQTLSLFVYVNFINIIENHAEPCKIQFNTHFNFPSLVYYEDDTENIAYYNDVLELIHSNINYMSEAVLCHPPLCSF